MLKKDRKKTKPTRREGEGEVRKQTNSSPPFYREEKRRGTREQDGARKRVNEAVGEKRKAALTVLLQLPLLPTPYQCRELETQ